MGSFGVQLLSVPFTRFVEILAKHDVAFDWPERNAGDQPMQAWEAYSELNDGTREEISRELVAGVRESINRKL